MSSDRPRHGPRLPHLHDRDRFPRSAGTATGRDPGAGVMAGQPATSPANGLLDQIGNTPIQAVALLIDGKWRTAHLKLEGYNPLGSIKDRSALSLVTDLKRRGGL